MLLDPAAEAGADSQLAQRRLVDETDPWDALELSAEVCPGPVMQPVEQATVALLCDDPGLPLAVRRQIAPGADDSSSERVDDFASQAVEHLVGRRTRRNHAAKYTSTFVDRIAARRASTRPSAVLVPVSCRPLPSARPAMKQSRSHTGGLAKVMVSLPDDLLARIDEEARRRSGSRSALLATAARAELARRDPDAIRAAVERSRRRFADVGVFDSTAAVRAQRDARR